MPVLFFLLIVGALAVYFFKFFLAAAYTISLFFVFCSLICFYFGFISKSKTEKDDWNDTGFMSIVTSITIFKFGVAVHLANYVFTFIVSLI